jgi:hypothetical protein
LIEVTDFKNFKGSKVLLVDLPEVREGEVPSHEAGGTGTGVKKNVQLFERDGGRFAF